MKKGLLALGALAMAFVIAIPTDAYALQAEVTFANIGRSFAPPSLGRRQGWLTITNRDWRDYDVSVLRRGTMVINPAGAGGTRIHSGTQVTLAVETADWDLTGSSGERLRVRVREGRTSTVDLQPFGFVGNTGLRGVSNDGDRVRTATLVNPFMAPPIIVQPPIVAQPPIIVQTPPPPPVIIQRPPVIIGGPSHRPRPPQHRPPSRPPSHRPSRPPQSGWGFSFGFNSR